MNRHNAFASYNQMESTYDPLHAPLDLPVQRLTVRCVLESPVQFTPAPGSTPGTTLSGLFGNVLWECGCQRRQRGLPTCNRQADQCQQPATCPVAWLYKPHSAVHRRTLTRPVLLYAPELADAQPVTAFTLQITLWGRHAVAARPLVIAVLQAMGNAGLGGHDNRVRFQTADITVAPPRTLAERAAALAAVDWQQALLVFTTPLLYRETVQIEPDRRDKLFLAGGELPLAGLLGNCAYELATWDMEDRELGASLDGALRHHLARTARETARTGGEALQLTRCLLTPASLGTRYSKSNGRAFPLLGFLGQAEVTGPLNPVLPWLLALNLGGGGQKRSMGFGVIQLWLAPP